MKKRLFYVLVLLVVLICFLPSCATDYVYIINYATYDKVDGKYIVRVKDSIIVEALTREDALVIFNDSVSLRYDCDSISTKIDFKKVLR